MILLGDFLWSEIDLGPKRRPKSPEILASVWGGPNVTELICQMFSDVAITSCIPERTGIKKSVPGATPKRVTPSFSMTSARLQSLETRLNTLHEAHKTTLQLITRLSNLKFQPGSLPGTNEGGDVRTELTSEIHESLKKEDEELEILRQEVQDVTSLDHSAAARRDTEKSKDQARLAVQIARLGEDFKKYVATHICQSSSAYIILAREQDSDQPKFSPNETLNSPEHKSVIFYSHPNQTASQTTRLLDDEQTDLEADKTRQ